MINLRRQPLFKMFAPKRKNRGTMWVSLIGLGLSAAVYGVTRGNRKDIAGSFQNVMKNFTQKNNVNLMGNAALTEFSEELLDSALRNKR
jgi:hypothetical protein